MAMASPQKDDTITFETLKKLLGAPQARHIWAQKQVAEVGILYDDKALEAALRATNKSQIPVAADIRLAAPAVVAYWRDANPKSRHLFAEWAYNHLQMPKSQRAEAQPSAPAMTRHKRITLMADPALKMEQAAAFAAGMGYCPNHPPGERVKPRSEFAPVANGPGGLAWRCRKCNYARQRATDAGRRLLPPRTTDPVLTRIRLAAIHKAQEIMVISRRLERVEGMAHAEAVARARREWEANRTLEQSVPLEDLPPLPAETERPYEAEVEESELVAVNSGEEVHQ